MKIRALWGFVGDKAELKNDSGAARAGQEFEVGEEYGHALIGKGLAADASSTVEPKSKKPVAPKETK